MARKFILTLLLAVNLCGGSQAFAVPVELDNIAAVVNKNIITQSQLDQRVAQVKQTLAVRQIQAPGDDVLVPQVLQMLINESLTEQMAKRLNITATTQDIQHAIANIAAEQRMTPAQLRTSLQQQGLSEQAFIQQVTQQIVQQKLLQQALATQITVTPQEIDAGVKMAQSQAGQNNEYHLLHILVPLPDSPTPQQIKQAQIKANNIIGELKQGASFQTLAASESSGAQMFNGGDMGWKTLAELPTIFANRVLTMKKNDVTSPIQTANGFHILKLIASRGKASNVNNAELKQKVGQMIFQRKLEEKQEQWLGQLRASAYIKIYYKPETLPTPDL